MNRQDAMRRMSSMATALGILFLVVSGVLMYTVPIADVLTCTRRDGQCVVKHRTMLKSRTGAVPIAALTAAELRPSRRRGADRLELWLNAGSQEFWLTDYAAWQRAEADGRLSRVQRFMRDPSAPRLEVRRDFLGGPIGALVSLLVGCVGLVAGWRLRMELPGTAR
jgi:hypothetical protein